MRTSFRRRRIPLLTFTIAVAATAFLTVPSATAAGAPAIHPAAHTAVQPAVSGVRPNDVYIRDTSADNSITPSTGTMYLSPDIVVCPGTAVTPCATDIPLVTGAVDNVFVALRNTGPAIQTGTLTMYFTPGGSANYWGPGDTWNVFDVVSNIAVPAAGTTVKVPWTVAGTGHWCLMAQWSSPTDPVLNEPDTGTYTQYNNNVAWHNIDPGVIQPGSSWPVPFTLHNYFPTTQPFQLVFASLGNQPFVGPGALVVDLGPTLGPAWIKAGQQGVGIAPLGGNLVRITDPQLARIQGLSIDPRTSPQVNLTFQAGSPVSATELVYQATADGTDVGGVAYPITVR